MADVREVRKEGDYYVVKGRHGDRDTSVHIPAPSVESLDRKRADELFRRSVERTVNAERENG